MSEIIKNYKTLDNGNKRIIAKLMKKLNKNDGFLTLQVEVCNKYIRGTYIQYNQINVAAKVDFDEWRQSKVASENL